MKSIVKTICVLSFLFCFVDIVGQSEKVDTSKTAVDTLTAAQKLYKAAEALLSEKKYEEAIEKYDEAAMTFLEEDNVQGFELTNQYIHYVSANFSSNSKFEYYKDKIKFCEERFGNEDAQTGFWHLFLGELSQKFQEFDSAKEHYYQALGIFSKVEERHKETINCNARLGALLFAMEYRSQAEKIMQNSILSLETFFDENLIDEEYFEKQLASHYLTIAKIKSKQDLYEEAAEYYEQSIQINIKYEDYYSMGFALYEAGQNYFDMSAPLKAEEYLLKGASHLRKLFGEQHYLIASSYNELGKVYADLKDYEQSIAYFEKSLAIRVQQFGENHPRLGTAYLNLGLLNDRLGEKGIAEKYLYKSKKIIENSSPDPTLEKFQVNWNLGNLWFYQNIKIDSALILFQQALEEGKAFYGERHSIVSSAFLSIANIYNYKQEYDKALQNTQKALVAATYHFDDLNVSKNPDPDNFIDHLNGSTVLFTKSKIISALWSANKENKDLIDLFQDCTKLGNVLLNRTTKETKGQLLESASYASTEFLINKIIENNFIFYLHLNQPEFIEDCAFWMGKLKAQNLLLTFQKAKATSFANIPTELISKEQSFLHKIDSLEQLVFRALETKDSTTVDEIQNGSLFETKRAREKLIANLEKNHPEYYQLKYDLEPVKLKDLKAQISENTIYIELSIEEKGSNLFFLTLTNQEEHIFKSKLIPDFAQKITSYNKLLRSHNLLRADRRRKFIQLSHELYQQFIQPIEHLLIDKERMVIVGEGMTHYLPFETLLKNNEDKPWYELNFLIRNHEVSYHYSGTLFSRAQDQVVDFDNELLAFAPVFADGESTLATLRGAAGNIMTDSTFRSVEDDNFSPLPYSEEEVESISNLFPKSSNVTVLLNEKANEVALKSALEQNHRFVHIASHSFANIDYPKFSGIACAPSLSETDKDDGILYVGEIYNLAVKSDLVVLSSCESGVGKLQGGEGLLGLNRSFVYAGVPNVIFSLWKVYDEATGKMMSEFYKNTLQGQSYSKALRASKLKMLEDPKTATPDIWGAFLLVGR